jgi:uncharacterized protein (DUF736 family)
MSDLNDRELGALWRKTSKSGNPFYSGNLMLNGQKYEVIAFDNDRKTKENHPDIRIYLSEDRDDRGSGSGSYQGRQSNSRTTPPARTESRPAPAAPAAIEYPTEDIDPDDIPF